jgi:16S rRNA G966 N2-methylase RsmD
LNSPGTVAEIKPAAYNPRKISDEQLEILKKSMQEYRDLSGIVVNVRTSHLVGGHQRVKELKPEWEITKRPLHDKTGTVASGWIETPFGRFAYREVNWDLLKEKAANLAANKISGDWDNEKLAPILEELVVRPEQLALTGFNLKEANLIIEGMRQPDDEDIDIVPPLPVTPFTKPGQLLKLGKNGQHRLVCGDARKPETWMKLMAGVKADLVVTDPPYGVDMQYTTGKASYKNNITGKRHLIHPKVAAMQGDASTDVAVSTLPLIFENLRSDGAAYFTAGTELMVDIYTWLRAHDIHYGVGMFWLKDQDVVSWNHYHPRHENIIFAGKGSLPGGSNKRWFGPKGESTVWDIPLEARGSKMHRAQKPVAIYERAIINSSAPREIIVDPFAGSGTAVIGAEKLGRRAFMIENEPAYCDVIVKRLAGFMSR